MLIKKNEALRILEKSSGVFHEEVVLPQVGNTTLLHTGAKMYAVKKGAVVRYGVYGYAWDGSDLKF